MIVRFIIALLVILVMIGLGIFLYDHSLRESEWISLWLMSFTATGVAAIVALMLIERRIRKIELVNNLRDQFNSESLIFARSVVDKLCDKYDEDKKAYSYMELYKSISPLGSEENSEWDRIKVSEYWIAFSMLVNFFSRLGVLIERNDIERKTAEKMFKSYFVYFYQREFIREMIRRTHETGEPSYWLHGFKSLERYWVR
jgi:hypothetical protein